MVNKKQWDEAFGKLREIHLNDDYNFIVFRLKMLDALGDDEADALEFLKELSKEDKAWLTLIDEEIMSKYPSDEMVKFIEDEVITPENLSQSSLMLF